ncbi:MAG TPA: hypothetical protein VFT45_10975, partial [Longimicrobium sp.]|nr:hypothetical protein [Longimicrobium sp.]
DRPVSAAASSHRVAAIRLAAAGRVETGYALSLRPGPRGTRVRLGGAPPPAAEVADAAERTFRRLRDRLPPSRRETLEVEAGMVERRDARSSVRRRYVLALAGGRLVHLAAGVRGEAGTPWRGEGEMDTDADALPVVLGASAVLTLVEYLLEAAGGDVRRAGGILPPLLRARRAARSPYPPRDVRGCGGEALAALAARPELWGTPFGALPCDELGTLSVRARTAALHPPRAAVIDSLLPVTGDARSAEWEASLGLVRDGEMIAVAPATVRLRLDAARLLAGAAGGVGSPVPALRRDPFRGDRYGIAPPLLTRARLGALRGGGP